MESHVDFVGLVRFLMGEFGVLLLPEGTKSAPDELKGTW
jgi:hypothetical protein